MFYYQWEYLLVKVEKDIVRSSLWCFRKILFHAHFLSFISSRQGLEDLKSYDLKDLKYLKLAKIADPASYHIIKIRRHRAEQGKKGRGTFSRRKNISSLIRSFQVSLTNKLQKPLHSRDIFNYI